MGDVIFSKPTSYRLLELLGEGLNSYVYRAIKENEEFKISQSVAVKILKSEKLVSIWRNEITRISQIRSKYCVGYYGWEIIAGKPALILEHVRGVTLEELITESSLSKAELIEILGQSYYGLRDLQDAGLFHGDINLHNIMIDDAGCVKLVDFGVYDSEGAIFTTPKYADARVLSGELPTLETDIYSLRSVGLDIARKFKLSMQAHNLAEFKLDQGVQLKLAVKVNEILEKQARRQGFTEKLAKITSVEWSFKRLSQVVAMMVIFCIPLFSLGDQKPGAIYSKPALISVRSNNWLELKINGEHLGYAPVDAEIYSQGTVHIEWVSPSGSGQTVLTVRQGQHIVIDDVFIANL